MITWPSSRQSMSSVAAVERDRWRGARSGRGGARRPARRRRRCRRPRVMPAPRSQTRSRICSRSSTVATPILARSGNSGSCSRTRAERRQIDRLGIGDEERRMRVADIGADRLAPAGRPPDSTRSRVHARGRAESRAKRCAPVPYRRRSARRAAARLRAARPRSRCAIRGFAGFLGRSARRRSGWRCRRPRPRCRRR